MNKISDKELETCFPRRSTRILNSMNKEEKDKYMEMYNLYRTLYTQYIIEKLDLKKYDESIGNSELNFIKTEEKDMDIYQYYTADILKYFYIRNNIYIERLDEESKKVLTEKIKSKDYQLDEQSRKMIKNTYKSIIDEVDEDKQDGRQYITSFGPDSGSFLARSNSVVIGFRYNEFEINGLEDNEWKDNYINQLELTGEIIKEILKECPEDIKNNITILKYTHFSVIKKQAN